MYILLDSLIQLYLGFDFNAINDDDSTWVHTYYAINAALQDPFYFIFPIFDQTLIRLFPKRMAVHKEMDHFNVMLSKVIENKRAQIASGVQNDNLQENEKDVLTLLIESEQRGEGALTDEELRVSNHLNMINI